VVIRDEVGHGDSDTDTDTDTEIDDEIDDGNVLTGSIEFGFDRLDLISFLMFLFFMFLVKILIQIGELE